MPQHAECIVTSEEVDEAIWWVLMTAPRNVDYMKIIDALLDQRNDINAGRRGPGAHRPARRY
jgi:hypothetical protein